MKKIKIILISGKKIEVTLDVARRLVARGKAKYLEDQKEDKIAADRQTKVVKPPINKEYHRKKR